MSCKNKCDDLSQYDKKVTIQSLSGTADAFGHIDNTASGNWSTYTTAYAKCISKGGREFWKIDKMEADVSHVWRCPYDSTLAAASPDMRLVYDSVTYQIVSVVHVDINYHEIEIQTKRAV